MISIQQFLIYIFGQYRFYFQFMQNPFKNAASPISDLYSRSRIKSKQNRQCSRTPVQSFRQFQVKVIRNALKNNHIIQKQYQGQQQNAFERQRRRSKYLGPQSQRYETSQPKKQELKRRDSSHCSTGKQSLLPKEVRFQKKGSQKSETLVNFDGYSILNVKSQRMMTYSSNYDVKNDQKSAGYILPTCAKIRVSKQLETQDLLRPHERRCSITNSLISDNDDPYKIKRTSKAQFSNNRIDRIREEYFNGDDF